ncbi:MAG: diphthine--ammonia ligase [Candidatus Aenigmatarchaeota archaeon]
MKLAAIYSGGKDSTLAILKVSKENSIECLINIIPSSEESYFFHYPNTKFVKYQAEAMEIPLIQEKSDIGEEIEKLESLIDRAILEYKIEGIVCGVIKSKFQFEKFKKICEKFGIKFVTPLWQVNEFEVLEEILRLKIDAIITGIAAYPLDESYLGRKIDEKFIEDMKILSSKFGINPSGEGGEYETFVLDAPNFRKKIIIKSSKKIYKNYSGILVFEEVELMPKLT